MRRLPPMGALEAFAVVAQHRTLRSASEELNLSVSALSRRIQTLEAYVGKPLFERLHHELRPTQDGEWLVAHATPLFEGLSQVLGDLQQSGSTNITVGVPPSFAGAWLLPRINRFREAYPNIALSFDSSGTPLTRLGNGLDAVIVFAETIVGDFYSRELKPQTAFAVCAPELLGPAPDPAKVIAEQVVLVHRGLPKVLPLWLEAMGLQGREPRRVDYYDSGPMLLAAAESGLGVALTLEDTVNFCLGGDRLIRPFGESVSSPYSYHFVCKRPALAGRALRRFHDWLLGEAALG